MSCKPIHLENLLISYLVLGGRNAEANEMFFSVIESSSLRIVREAHLLFFSSATPNSHSLESFYSPRTWEGMLFSPSNRIQIPSKKSIHIRHHRHHLLLLLLLSSSLSLSSLFFFSTIEHKLSFIVFLVVFVFVFFFCKYSS